jgi:hypothetical protein
MKRPGALAATSASVALIHPGPSAPFTCFTAVGCIMTPSWFDEDSRGTRVSDRKEENALACASSKFCASVFLSAKLIATAYII